MLQVGVNMHRCTYEKFEPVAPILVTAVKVESWEDQVQQELHQGFDMGRGPLFRITFVETSAGFYVITTCHHVIADATSTYNLHKELLQLCQEFLSQATEQTDVTGEEEEKAPASNAFLLHEKLGIPQNTLDIIPEEYRLSVIGIGWTVLKLFSQLTACFALNNFLMFPVPKFQYNRQRRQSFIVYEFDQETTSALVSVCRKHQITLTNLIHACSAVSVVESLTKFDTNGRPTQSAVEKIDALVPMCVTVDLRRNVEGCNFDQSSRCYSSSIYTMLHVKTSPNENATPIWALSQASRHCIEQSLEKKQHLHLQQAQFFTTKFIKIDDRFYVPVVFGNLGRWEDLCMKNKFFNSSCKGFFYSTSGSFNSLYLYTVTCDNRLRICLSYNASLNFPHVVNEFVDRLVYQLKSVV
jgi:NRPS condensation-like uncharacterized protein